jgi:hypothetical protein
MMVMAAWARRGYEEEEKEEEDLRMERMHRREMRCSRRALCGVVEDDAGGHDVPLAGGVEAEARQAEEKRVRVSCGDWGM